MAEIYQIFVKHLDGRTRCLRLATPTISGSALKQALLRTTAPIPAPHSIRLISGTSEISDSTLLSASGPDRLFPSCALLLRLRGGKGGFGSLLRGAATKAGQKKTNNFDACRDMSGRRLRHVNAEKKLDEWRAEAEERKLEKIAEEFIKKKAKAAKKAGPGGGAAAEKYIEKYREDSAKCMEVVGESVRESFALYEIGKRKALPSSGPASKRTKIWLGKGKEIESDSDDDENEDDEKSVVLDDANCSHPCKKDEENSGSGSVGQSDGESSGGGSAKSQLEEENGVSSAGEDVNSDLEGPILPQSGVCEHVGFEFGDGSGSTALDVTKEAKEGSGPGNGTADSTSSIQSNSGLCALGGLELEKGLECRAANGTQGASENEQINIDTAGHVEQNSGISEGAAIEGVSILSSERPLNFDEFNSSAEMEVLGLDRLKVELQARGLKCGGTLQERAARLFLLKTMPIEKLPKKLLAKTKG